MSAPITALIDGETVTAVAGEVWSALVGEEELLLPRAVPVDGPSSWVTVTGPWDGVVVLTCAASGTADLARSVLQLDDDEQPTAEDVDDVLRELANILGGNVKSLLPGPSALGLPETGPAPLRAEDEDTCRVSASWRGHDLAITIQGASEAPATTTTEVPK
ncbi:chemotaxis protein CheX [Klenkia brasiliensis]|uniref:Chemotaxis phosphatase CheX n=1 Tax=Klenkia brasiliensis TaxID=333142 RepID=A0A1G7PNV7_9ACTN|nr:chemotaxis protein CheX [Klenkia brasiliensis]SDF88082.1 Chemotaxis phosphatase CheX [Klenkia brasiliensis]